MFGEASLGREFVMPVTVISLIPEASRDLGHGKSLQVIGPKLALLWKGSAGDTLGLFQVVQCRGCGQDFESQAQIQTLPLWSFMSLCSR